MMILFLLNGEIINNKQFVAENGTSYPSNWLMSSSKDERNNIGILELKEVYNELPVGFCHSSTYVDTDTERIYDIVPVPDDMKIK